MATDKLLSELNKGAWDNSTSYTIGDFISHNGSSYVCIDNNTNEEPPNITYWALIASGGGDVIGPASSTTNRVAVFDGITGKILKDGGETITEIKAASIPSTYLDTDGTLATNSDTKVASQKAVKSYVDSGTATLTNKTLTTPQINDTSSDHQYIFAGSELTADRTVTLPLLTGNDEFVFKDHAQILTNKTYKLTAAPGSDHNVSGTTIELTATSNMVFGDVGYIASTGKVTLIDADAIASMSAIVMCADATINADASGNYLLMGIARDDTWNWTVGGLIYGTVTGTTGNTLSQTAPSATDDVIQIMGVATHADRMYFNPQIIQVEHT